MSPSKRKRGSREVIMKGNEKSIASLKQLLADTYTLYLKTQNYHWNVKGPGFFSLHALFEQQYTDLAAAVDEIAERIRALGHRAPGSFAEFSALATLKEAKEKTDAAGMVKDLQADQLTMVRQLKKIISSAEKEGDTTTVDVATGRLAVHEKNAWMLGSSL